MASFIIEGGHRLSGTITPQGAKNEALQVICATLLTKEEVVIENIPDILDVNNLIRLLQEMGVSVHVLTKRTIRSRPSRSIWPTSSRRTLCERVLHCGAPS